MISSCLKGRQLGAEAASGLCENGLRPYAVPGSGRAAEKSSSGAESPADAQHVLSNGRSQVGSQVSLTKLVS